MSLFTLFEDYMILNLVRFRWTPVIWRILIQCHFVNISEQWIRFVNLKCLIGIYQTTCVVLSGANSLQRNDPRKHFIWAKPRRQDIRSGVRTSHPGGTRVRICQGLSGRFEHACRPARDHAQRRTKTEGRYCKGNYTGLFRIDFIFVQIWMIYFFPHRIPKSWSWMKRLAHWTPYPKNSSRTPWRIWRRIEPY